MSSDFNVSPVMRVRLAKSMELARWIDKNKPGEMETRSFAESVSAAYFSLALEHHIAVASLLRDALPSSAFALLRSVFDAYWRGEWAHKVATPAELERFRTGVFEPAPDRTLKALRRSHPEIGDLLELIKRANWEALSGFTHGGFSQIAQQLTQGYIGPRFSDELCSTALGFADHFAIVSAVSLAEIARTDTRPFEEMAAAVIASSPVTSASAAAQGKGAQGRHSPR